jgi:hypothetical protein
MTLPNLSDYCCMLTEYLSLFLSGRHCTRHPKNERPPPPPPRVGMAVSPWYVVLRKLQTYYVTRRDMIIHITDKNILVYISRNHFPIVSGAQPSFYLWVPGGRSPGINQHERETSRSLVLYLVEEFIRLCLYTPHVLMASCLGVGTIVSTYLHIQH